MLGPPRAIRRSLSSGAPPASIANTISQVRVLAPAERRERQPRRLHLRDVVGQRPPPQRLAELRGHRRAVRAHARDARTAVRRGSATRSSTGRADPAARARRARRRSARSRCSRGRADRRRRRARRRRSRSAPRPRTQAAAPRRPSRWASISSSALSRGSASIPIGLEIAITARSSPSSRTRAARCSGASAAHVDHVGLLGRAVQDGHARPRGGRAAACRARRARPAVAASRRVGGRQPALGRFYTRSM